MKAGPTIALCVGLAAMTGLSANYALAAAEFEATWDQIANIKDAAERLGKLHRQRGVKGAYDFIDACYRTHSLAEHYGQAFESCIAQDYLETKMLAELYARMPPEALRKLGAPTPEILTQAMVRRVSAAFAQYEMPFDYGEELTKIVEQHGMPVFIGIVLPQAVRDMEERTSKGKKQ